MKILSIFLGMILTQQAMASTFVGNGGNAGDVEMQMTLQKAQKTFEAIDTDRPQNLCVCSAEFEGRPMCDVLKRLNAEQVRFCSRYMTMKAGELSQITGDKKDLNVTWTHEQIEVQEEGHLRGADAVTNAKQMSMTLNQQRFLGMDENERLFLVSHELFHLTSFQGKTLSDEGDIGPFKGVDGGREFINAMAAAVVLQASENGVFQQYQAAEKRSKGYKKTYISLGYNALSVPNDTTTAFDIDRTTGVTLGVRYQLTPEFGLIAQMAALKGDKTILTSINAKENKNIYSFGAGYRWFPFSNPMTAWGQSHFVFSATVDLLDGTYTYDEQGVGGSAKATSTGLTAACNYFMPLDGGFWIYGGVGYSAMNYSYNLDNQVDLKYKDNGTSFALGVSYGF